jgi:hypothetical protein
MALRICKSSFSLGKAGTSSLRHWDLRHEMTSLSITTLQELQRCMDARQKFANFMTEYVPMSVSVSMSVSMALSVPEASFLFCFFLFFHTAL